MYVCGGLEGTLGEEAGRKEGQEQGSFGEQRVWRDDIGSGVAGGRI